MKNAYLKFTELYLRHVALSYWFYVDSKMTPPPELLRMVTVLKQEVDTQDAPKAEIDFCWSRAHDWGFYDKMVS